MEIISYPQNTKFNQKQKFNQIDKNIRITPPPLLLHDKLLELPPEVLLASVPVLEDVGHHGLVILADPHAGWEDEGLARGNILQGNGKIMDGKEGVWSSK